MKILLLFLMTAPVAISQNLEGFWLREDRGKPDRFLSHYFDGQVTVSCADRETKIISWAVLAAYTWNAQDRTLKTENLGTTENRKEWSKWSNRWKVKFAAPEVFTQTEKGYSETWASFDSADTNGAGSLKIEALQKTDIDGAWRSSRNEDVSLMMVIDRGRMSETIYNPLSGRIKDHRIGVATFDQTSGTLTEKTIYATNNLRAMIGQSSARIIIRIQNGEFTERLQDGKTLLWSRMR